MLSCCDFEGEKMSNSFVNFQNISHILPELWQKSRKKSNLNKQFHKKKILPKRLPKETDRSNRNYQNHLIVP